MPNVVPRHDGILGISRARSTSACRPEGRLHQRAAAERARRRADRAFRGDGHVHAVAHRRHRHHWSSIGSSMRHLATHPDDRRRCWREPELWSHGHRGAAPCLRARHHGRRMSHDTESKGCPMKAGDRVLMDFPAANRDPEVFPDADKVILDRENNRHVAFGAGIHRCAGSNLARMELRVASRSGMERVPEFELEVPTAEVTWAGGQVAARATSPSAEVAARHDACPRLGAGGDPRTVRGSRRVPARRARPGGRCAAATPARGARRSHRRAVRDARPGHPAPTSTRRSPSRSWVPDDSAAAVRHRRRGLVRARRRRGRHPRPGRGAPRCTCPTARPGHPPVLAEAAASLLPDGPRPAVVFHVRLAPDGTAHARRCRAGHRAHPRQARLRHGDRAGVARRLRPSSPGAWPRPTKCPVVPARGPARTGGGTQHARLRVLVPARLPSEAETLRCRWPRTSPSPTRCWRPPSDCSA